MHKEAEESEAIRLASKKDGGIRQLMSARVTFQRKTLIGSLQMIYWLVKEDGCNYMCELLNIQVSRL